MSEHNVSTRRVIVVGKSGNGKSSTGNSMLGRAEFEHGKRLVAVTKTCEVLEGNKQQNKLCYKVCDTPGLLDTDTDVIKRVLEVQRSVEACPKPHAFLIVFSTNNRMTTDEDYTIDLLRMMFGENVFKHCIIVFTHGSDNISSDDDFEKFYKESPMLADLLKRCEDRIVRIENKKDDVGSPIADGIDGLLEMIEQVSNNGSRVYNYAMLEVHTNVLKEHYGSYKGDNYILSKLKDISVKLKRDLKDDWILELVVARLKDAIRAGAVVGAVVGTVGTSGAMAYSVPVLASGVSQLAAGASAVAAKTIAAGVSQNVASASTATANVITASASQIAASASTATANVITDGASQIAASASTATANAITDGASQIAASASTATANVITAGASQIAASASTATANVITAGASQIAAIAPVAASNASPAVSATVAQVATGFLAVLGRVLGTLSVEITLSKSW